MSVATSPALVSAPSTPLPQLTAAGPISASSKPHVQSLMPSPAIFDVLPLLHELVSRVFLSENINAGTPTATAPVSTMYPGQQPIAIHQLAAEVSVIRNRMRKARALTEALPDVDRCLQEQQEDIEDLKIRIEEQKHVLKSLNSQDNR